MTEASAGAILDGWPDESREAAQLVLDKYGEPDEATPSSLVWFNAGEVSARCHDEEANRLALNLMHDIVTGEKDVEQARAYYAEEFAGYRKKEPTPYMEKLRFSPQSGTGDPDQRVLSDQDLEQAAEEGERKEQQ
ncbi:hypothetical protein FDW83_07230 [Pseudarthrobacter sp. NamE2]|uniref:hypothetical protein n=1 Tax=Pseudarthrobacter sp. NamE2 TaxID=2576838 RepID=UPI0010FE0C42|nr:hypothetical protein [Pseudarthrobacter sp. NamE2]TLM84505.1 hypothetical protein FDW83_07230 [Pseudarthrobacter sp. NamE2]